MASEQNLTPEYLAQDEGLKMINCAIAFAILQMAFAGLFFVSRFKRKMIIGVDSTFVLLGLIFSLCLHFSCIFYVRRGWLGRHWAALSIPRKMAFAKLELLVVYFYPPAVCFSKLAILWLYLRIFTTKTYRYLAYILAFILVLNMVMCWIIASVMCRPFRFHWDKSIPGGRCLNEQAIFTWFRVPNIITDVAMLVLPLPVVWNLHTSFNQKIGLTATFITGSFGMITAIISAYIFFTSDVSIDMSWKSTDTTIWTIVEPTFYFIAVCLPSLRPLFRTDRLNLESIRSVLRFSSAKSRPHDSASGLQLSDMSKPARNTTPHKNPRSGFQRLEDDWKFGSLEDGNGQRGLVSISGGTLSGDNEPMDIPLDELGHGNKAYGIKVQRDYTLTTETRNG